MRDAGESGDAGDTDSGEDGGEGVSGWDSTRFERRYFGLQSQNRALSSLVLRLQRRGQFDDRFKFGREGIKALEQVIEDARVLG